MRMYGVVSPCHMIQGYDFEPPEPHHEFIYVCTRNARRAKVLAVRVWRRRNAHYLNNAENPFTGVVAKRLDHLPQEEIAL